MIYLKYTYVDAVTGVSISEAPAVNGPKAPEIEGLSFSFAAESQYPATVPLFFGTAPDGSDVSAPGVLDVLDAAGYEAARVAELDARKAIKHQLRNGAQCAAERAGFLYNGEAFDSDDRSREKISQAVTGAMLAQAQGMTDAQFAAMISGGWRNTAGDAVVATIQDMIGLGLAMGDHMGACDVTSQSIKTLINAAETMSELNAIDVSGGYPEVSAGV